MPRRLTFALLCLAGLLAAGDGAGRHYKNDRWGYKLRAPSGWIHAALSADEEWIASKHLGKRELRSKKGIFVSDERPEMWVIGFPHARKQDNETRVTKKKKSDVTSVFEFSFKNPYKDYKDFIRRERWFVGGGYYFSEEKEGEVAGMKVTMYEIKVEKMVAAPFRMVTWVFHADDVDFAVQFKILEDYYRSYKGTIRTCLKSFRRIPRKRALPGTSVTTGKKTITVEKPDDELTPEELKKRRLDKVEQAFRREIDALPKGWYHKRSEHFLVLSNGSKKYVRNVIAHAEAIRTYLDETFGSLGVDYVPPAIIRIFKTSVESRAYSQGTRRFWGNTSQVLLTEEWNTPQSTTWQITDQWLNFKNGDLTWNMPDWISSGLREHMGFARSKGKKVKFVFDSWDKESLKKLLKNDEAVPLQKLIMGVEARIVIYASAEDVHIELEVLA